MKKSGHSSAAFLLVMGLTVSTLHAAEQEGEYMDHGVPAPVTESRGAIAAADADGNPIIVAVTLDRTLLLIDALTGETTTFVPPGELPIGPNFSFMGSSRGLFYVMMEETFLEFDPNKRDWTFVEDPKCGTAMSLAEGPDGAIYAATYPRSELLAFDPETRALVRLGQLDTVEQYPYSCAVDASGWVYAGIGTARSNLVAFNPKTRERIQLVAEEDRAVGRGQVFKGVDGHVYGQGGPDRGWRRLFEGKALPVEQPGDETSTRSISWGRVYREFPDGSLLTAFDMPGKTFEVTGRDGGKRQLPFDYESEGAVITSLGAGPGDKIYGSTAHPFRFFSYDPKTGEMVNHGGLRAVGGGNWRGLAVLGKTIYGGAYARGILYAFDTTRPFVDSEDERANPRELVRFPVEIARPRTVLAHPDGRHLLFAGYAGYGKTGGGICVYDLAADEATLIENASILPGHSTITLKALPDGNLAGGTSIHAPGGGMPVAQTARFYIIDMRTHEITYDVEPVPGATAIQCIEVDEEGKVYGITDNSVFFVLDTNTKEVVARTVLEAHGDVLHEDQSLRTGPDGELYLVMSKSVFRIDREKNLPVKVLALPVEARAGLGIIAGRLYFGAGSRLYSVALDGRDR